jgi:prophage DNA circulation protein
VTDALATLAEWSFMGTAFPAAHAQTEGGHDGVEHTAYLRPGADIEPTGQRAYRGTFTVPCINTPRLVARYGELFPTFRNTLIALFRENPIGDLTHPTFGTFRAFIHGWSEELSADSRGGVVLSVQWTEHNGEASEVAGNAASQPANTTSSVSRLATQADAACKGFVGYVPVGALVAAQLFVLEGSALPFTAVAECFRRMLDPIGANLALAAFSVASAHAATVALLMLQAAVLDLRSRYMPTLAASRIYVVPAAMALWQVAEMVYGDASRTTLLRAANAIPDPTLVPAGTRLVILPNA